MGKYEEYLCWQTGWFPLQINSKSDENIQKHLENVMKKVKLENGDKANTPERLAPEIWERMKSTAKRNFIYEDIL